MFVIYIAGPDPKNCGFRVYNNSLYMNINDKYDEDFFSHVDTYIGAGMLVLYSVTVTQPSSY